MYNKRQLIRALLELPDEAFITDQYGAPLTRIQQTKMIVVDDQKGNGQLVPPGSWVIKQKEIQVLGQIPTIAFHTTGPDLRPVAPLLVTEPSAGDPFRYIEYKKVALPLLEPYHAST